ncbi:MAG: hypothetical protein IPL42_09590 [Saprospiraceae bacterium]|nr:hypothetical protein [Saprospiraceae bacterium]
MRDTIIVSGCNNVNYKGINYTHTSTRNDTLKNISSCDSLIRLVNINVNQVIPITQNINLTGCNTPVIYQGNTYNTSTIVRDTLRSY